MECLSCYKTGTKLETLKEWKVFSWIETYTCYNPECQKVIWNVCGVCSRKRRFDKSNQLSQHQYRCHNIKKSKMKTSDAVSIDSNFGDDFVSEYTEQENTLIMLKKSLFLRPQTHKFIEYEMTGSGASYIISRGCHQIDVHDNNIQSDEIILHLRLAEFCNNVSRNQREQFAYILQNVIEFTKKKLIQSQNGSSDSHISTEIPVTIQKLRSTYLSGEHSVLNNLPHPNIQEIENHAYVSLREIIQNMLALRSLTNHRKVAFTKKFLNILSRAKDMNPSSQMFVAIEILEWSDDFDPNHLKNNRGSVWIKTVTLRTVLVIEHICMYETSREETFPVALGHKGDSHEPIEKQFSNELIDLCTAGNGKYFYGEKNCMVPVYAELSVSLQDQPERRSANQLLGGNSTMHGRWGYSADIVALSLVLPPCYRCFEIMKKGRLENNSFVCIECTNWSMDVESPLLQFIPPSEYPADELPPTKTLVPKRITYSGLIDAVTKARRKLENKEWSFNNAEAFLGLLCITKGAISDLLDAALMRRHLNDDSSIDNDESVTLTQALFREYPQYFIDKPMPALWTRNSQLLNHVDVPMHLIFLGIVKATINMIKDWVKVRGHNTAYQEYATKALKHFPFTQWCVVETYSGDKLAGWVSENYLAFSRLIKWFYCNCSELFYEKNPYADPVGEVTRWPKPICIRWLEVRGVDFDTFVESYPDESDSLITEINVIIVERRSMQSTPVATLRKMIRYYQEAAGAMPPLVSDGFCDAEDMITLIQSLHKMVASIMTCNATEEEIGIVEYEIKMFLSLVNVIDKSMNTNKGNSKTRWKPKWISMYNFICLLNIPSIIRENGPIRNIWEGSNKGEGFIRIIKPELSSGRRKNWQYSKMKRLLQQNSLNTVLRNQGIQNTISEERKLFSSDFYLYLSLHAAHATKDSHRPLSGVIFNDSRFGLILVGNRIVEMCRDDKVPKKKKQLCEYTSWTLSYVCLDLSECTIFNYVLFLPMLQEDTDRIEASKQFYTVIHSTWQND